MGVHVNESRADNTSGCVDGFLSFESQTRRYFSNAAVFNADIGRVSFLTGSVDNFSVSNDDVEHYLPPVLQSA